jgi:hypothetical protein
VRLAIVGAVEFLNLHDLVVLIEEAASVSHTVLSRFGGWSSRYCRACRRLFSVFCSADRVLAPDRDPL